MDNKIDIKMTKEEFEVFLTIKKQELSNRDVKTFLKLFNLLLDKGYFTCKGGKKTALFDGDGTLREIIVEQKIYKKNKLL